MFRRVRLLFRVTIDFVECWRGHQNATKDEQEERAPLGAGDVASQKQHGEGWRSKRFQLSAGSKATIKRDISR